eukprot:3445063-Pleurochrysis_carterae.AAC.1
MPRALARAAVLGQLERARVVDVQRRRFRRPASEFFKQATEVHDLGGRVRRRHNLRLTRGQRDAVLALGSVRDRGAPVEYAIAGGGVRYSPITV